MFEIKKFSKTKFSTKGPIDATHFLFYHGKNSTSGSAWRGLQKSTLSPGGGPDHLLTKCATPVIYCILCLKGLGRLKLCKVFSCAPKCFNCGAHALLGEKKRKEVRFKPWYVWKICRALTKQIQTVFTFTSGSLCLLFLAKAN